MQSGRKSIDGRNRMEEPNSIKYPRGGSLSTLEKVGRAETQLWQVHKDNEKEAENGRNNGLDTEQMTISSYDSHSYSKQALLLSTHSNGV